MAQNRTCNLSVTGRPSSPLRHVFKVPPDGIIIPCKPYLSASATDTQCIVLMAQVPLISLTQSSGLRPLHPAGIPTRAMAALGGTIAAMLAGEAAVQNKTWDSNDSKQDVLSVLSKTQARWPLPGLAKST
jgi:hypothetical protein